MLSSAHQAICGPRGVASRTVLLLAGVLMLAASVPGQTGLTPMPAKATPAPKSPAPSANVDRLEQLVIELVNKERRKAGLEPLVVSPDLMSLARTYSRDMVERNYFSHVDPDGQLVYDRAESVGLTNWVNLGENIARNRGFSDPAAVAVREWLKSQSHRSVMLDPHYRETGVGVWVGPGDTFVFTEVFLTRAADTKPPTNP